MLFVTCGDVLSECVQVSPLDGDIIPDRACLGLCEVRSSMNEGW